jgi:hypothetical protein
MKIRKEINFFAGGNLHPLKIERVNQNPSL